MERGVRGELNTDGISNCQTLAEKAFEHRNRQAFVRNIYAVYWPASASVSATAADHKSCGSLRERDRRSAGQHQGRPRGPIKSSAGSLAEVDPFRAIACITRSLYTLTPRLNPQSDHAASVLIS
jgi:hypothetical protein